MVGFAKGHHVERMNGVDEINEEMAVEFVMVDGESCYVKAYNEAGHCYTAVDLKKLINWVRNNRPELLTCQANPTSNTD